MATLPTELVRCHRAAGSATDSLQVTMLRGSFNDQTECCALFLNSLAEEVRDSWTSSEPQIERLKDHYREMSPAFAGSAKRGKGEHKRAEMLAYRNFAWWASCVYRAAREVGSLEKLIEKLKTVEDAHDRFKRWYAPGGRTNLPRLLNAADAARLLAEYGHLRPEQRPLLARGALRGAAIKVDERIVRNLDEAERLYPDEDSRTALERRAADWARKQFGQDVRMDEVENWFCEEVHKKTR